MDIYFGFSVWEYFASLASWNYYRLSLKEL